MEFTELLVVIYLVITSVGIGIIVALTDNSNTGGYVVLMFIWPITIPAIILLSPFALLAYGVFKLINNIKNGRENN